MENFRDLEKTVFRTMFKDKNNILALYRALHPEDETTTKNDIDNITIGDLLGNDVFDDICFTVCKNNLMFVEFQDTYNPSMGIRFFLYYTEKLKRMQRDGTYQGGKLSAPEFIVIYTGEQKNTPVTAKLSDCFAEPENAPADLTVQILHAGKTPGDMIDQYLRFCAIAREDFNANASNEESKEKTIRTCIQNNILKEFFPVNAQILQ